MSGRSTCQAIQSIRTQGQTDREAIGVANNFSPGGLVDKIGARNESDNSIVNIDSFKNLKSIEIVDLCNNQINNIDSLIDKKSLVKLKLKNK